MAQSSRFYIGEKRRGGGVDIIASLRGIIKQVLGGVGG